MIYKSKIKDEKGVSLMVLIVSVIILLIISVIVITNFRGEDTSLINSIEDKGKELNSEKIKHDIELAIQKIKNEKSNIPNYTINQFRIDLEEYLKGTDSEATVVIDGDAYHVQYKKLTFTYKY